MIKDYNGQTYWLSASIHAFLRNESRFPKWLNVAASYVGEEMTEGASNPPEINGLLLPFFNSYRKFYIAPEIDLSMIKTGSQT